MVLYSTPAEGAFAFNQAALFDVKDGPRVLEALDQLVQGQALGGNFKLKKRPYQGVTIHEVSPRTTSNLVVPSYAVVNNKWLVVGLYPQVVQAFVQRTAGALPAWKPDAATQDALAKLPKGGQCLGFADLRPTVTQLLTFAPFVLEASRFNGNKPPIEPGMLPSAAAVNHHLFPNVIVQHDDGRTVRWDSRGSVLLPGDSLGADPLLLIFTLAFI